MQITLMLFKFINNNNNSKFIHKINNNSNNNKIYNHKIKINNNNHKYL